MNKRLPWAWRIAFGLLALVAIGSIFMSLAMAHSWYPLECCSEKDCEPVPESSVRITPQGFALPTGEIVPYRAARVSPDGQFHVCRYTPASPIIQPTGRAPCFWAPATGM